jgi:hypothetical protein
MDDEDNGDYYDHNGVLYDEFLEEEQEAKENEKDDESSGDEDDEGLQLKESSISSTSIEGEKGVSGIANKFEIAKIKGALAGMFSLNMPVHPELLKEIERRRLYDHLDTAELNIEMRDKVPIPIKMHRVFPSGETENWNLSDMLLEKDLPHIKNLQLEI